MHFAHIYAYVGHCDMYGSVYVFETILPKRAHLNIYTSYTLPNKRLGAAGREINDERNHIRSLRF